MFLTKSDLKNLRLTVKVDYFEWGKHLKGYRHIQIFCAFEY